MVAIAGDFYFLVSGGFAIGTAILLVGRNRAATDRVRTFFGFNSSHIISFVQHRFRDTNTGCSLYAIARTDREATVARNVPDDTPEGYAMETVVGLFTSQKGVDAAYETLQQIGIPTERISVLRPGATVEKVPTTEAEQPGMGQAVAGVVGGAFGAAAGAGLGVAAASILIPGVGPVIATGIFGALFLGASGAAVGMELGKSSEEFLDQGLPKDELFVYKDALKKGRTVMMVLVKDDTETMKARLALAESGAESVDPAREKWEIGLQDARRERYP
jgi:hypothetical protein